MVYDARGRSGFIGVCHDNWSDIHPVKVNTTSEIDAAHELEAKDFADDPHLALYCVMHFGLCAAPRFKDVAATLRAHGHDCTYDNIRMALAFSKGTDLTQDIDLALG